MNFILISALKCMCVCARMLSHSVVSDSATPWTVARQASLSIEFFRQEYWRLTGLPFPTQGLNPHLLRLLHSLPPSHLWSLSFKSCRSNKMYIFLSVMYRGSSRVICSLGLGSSPRCGCWVTSPLPSHWTGLSSPV